MTMKIIERWYSGTILKICDLITDIMLKLSIISIVVSNIITTKKEIFKSYITGLNIPKEYYF